MEDSAGSLRMLVGLGNPGRKYEETRHNLGFRVVSTLLPSVKILDRAVRRQALVWEVELEGAPVVVLLPQTYMNLSGEAVLWATESFGTPPSRVLVVCDDLSLPVGRIRLRRKGSSGGHKGLQSIIDRLGTEGFHRLRIGIGDPPGEDAEDYVLAPFEEGEEKEVAEALERAARAATMWVLKGIDEAMSAFNAGPE